MGCWSHSKLQIYRNSFSLGASVSIFCWLSKREIFGQEHQFFFMGKYSRLKIQLLKISDLSSSEFEMRQIALCGVFRFFGWSQNTGTSAKTCSYEPFSITLARSSSNSPQTGNRSHEIFYGFQFLDCSICKVLCPQMKSIFNPNWF